MKRVMVFCGSSSGTEQVYATQAVLLGQALATSGIELVYGGGKVGLMGALADAVLQAGGKVTGVLPLFMKNREMAHERLTSLIMVDTMHERKAKMNELSDGIIALPGGFGTLEELFEMLTWVQLGLHQKPIGILNVNGFYDHLLALLQNMVDKGFLKETNRNMLLVSHTIDDLFHQMNSHHPPVAEKRISKEKAVPRLPA